MLTALVIDASGPGRGTVERRVADRRSAERHGQERRGQLASAADALGSRRDLGGLTHAADAAAGRLAARRRDLAA